MRKGFATILILGIAVALFVLGATWYLKKSRLSSPSRSNNQITTQVEKNTATPSPQPTSIDTSNWKTYVDTKFGYSIKYPQGYEFQDFSKESNMLQDLCLVYTHSEGGCVVRIDLRQAKIGEYIASLDGGKDYRIVSKDYDFNGQNAQWIEYRALNDNSAIKYDEVIFVDFLLEKQNYLFDLYANGWGSQTEDIFNGMLSTLKFNQ